MNAAGNIVSTITSIQIQSANVIAITPCLEECESERINHKRHNEDK